MESAETVSSAWVISAANVRGLALLLQAYRLAGDAERPLWDLALEKASLESAGITNCDLRWMICKGLVYHGWEVTESHETSRRFHPTDSLSFCDRSCFVLTPEGEEFADELVSQAAGEAAEFANNDVHSKINGNGNSWAVNDHAANGSGLFGVRVPAQTLVPVWDAARHQLRVGATIVKEYKLPSPNQETIVAAFEEDGWPPQIDDPLPVHPDLDPKRRLHDTIKSLNRNQRSQLLRFMGDGTGEGIRWELLDA